MKKHRNIVMSALLLSGLLGTQTMVGAETKFRRSREPVKDQYLVVLDESVGAVSMPGVANELATRFGGRVRLLFNNVGRIFSVELTEPQATALAAHPLVKLVEENPVIHLSTDRLLTAELYNLDRVDQYGSADLQDRMYRYCKTGLGVTAYVVDTGVWKTHEEFNNLPNRVLNGKNTSGDGGYIWPGEAADYGTYPCGGDLSNNPNANHGTAVASILGGKDIGVAPEVSIVPVRIFKCVVTSTSGTGETALAGLNWIKDATPWTGNPHRNNRPALVNISWYYWATHDNAGMVARDAGAIETAIQALVLDNSQEGWTGISVIVSANNQNENQFPCAGYPSYPCYHGQTTPARLAYTNSNNVYGVGRVISVGATNRRDERWLCGIEPGDTCTDNDPGSNFGQAVDLYAPGTLIRSADGSCNTCYRPDYRSGTSFSSPLVAGVVARMLHSNPSLTPVQVWNQIPVSMAANPIDPVTGNRMIVHLDAAQPCP